MKKIISGKVYDTNTATKVGFYANGGNWRDYLHLEETLYRKKTGEFFLHGEGGPMTQYAEHEDQNSWTSGAQIIPMGYQAAREWAEKRLSAGEYESIFGPVDEDDSKQNVTFSLPKGLIERLKREAQESGVGLSALVESRLS